MAGRSSLRVRFLSKAGEYPMGFYSASALDEHVGNKTRQMLRRTRLKLKTLARESTSDSNSLRDLHGNPVVSCRISTKKKGQEILSMGFA